MVPQLTQSRLRSPTWFFLGVSVPAATPGAEVGSGQPPLHSPALAMVMRLTQKTKMWPRDAIVLGGTQQVRQCVPLLSHIGLEPKGLSQSLGTETPKHSSSSLVAPRNRGIPSFVGTQCHQNNLHDGFTQQHNVAGTGVRHTVPGGLPRASTSHSRPPIPRPTLAGQRRRYLTQTRSRRQRGTPKSHLPTHPASLCPAKSQLPALSACRLPA